MTDRLFDVLEKALIKKEADRLTQHFIRTVNTACDMVDRPSYEEPFGYANIGVAKQALFLAALPAITVTAQDRVFRKLLSTLEEVVNDGTE